MISVTAILIIAIVVYFAKDIFSAPKLSNPFGESTEDQPVVEGKFTPRTLSKFNGNDDPTILIAVKGKVFDVTPGATFYGPGGPYENFAGRDASRGLAKNSFESSMLTPLDDKIDLLQDLTKDEIESLDGWFDHFSAKYKCVGTLSNEE